MMHKPGIRTSEFWVTVVSNAAMLAAALSGVLAPKWAALAASISTVGYNIARGLSKTGSGNGRN